MEHRNLKIEEADNSDLGAVRRGFFGAKYLYLDDDTRVRYGFSLAHLGITYTLQRKKGIFWRL